MPWARASSLDRALACPGSSHLPRADHGRWEAPYVGEQKLPLVTIHEADRSAANWGTAMHDAKENSPAATDPWLSWVDPHRERLWPARLGDHEVAMAYDCRTRQRAVLVGAPLAERDAWKAAQPISSVVGTCDWAGLLPTGEPWVDDLKTGWAVPDVDTSQTLFYLLVHSQATKWETGRISITHWRRAKEPDEPQRYWRRVSKMILEDFEQSLVDAWNRVMLDDKPRPGAHCTYCPSAVICPRGQGF